MRITISESENHYYLVNGWKVGYKKNVADFSEQFDLYRKAKSYFERLQRRCEYVDFYEVIGTKKKLLDRYEPETDEDEETT